MERSEDISFWKTKSKDLQERITEEMAQEEMKWRLMPQEVEEKRNELTLAPIERQRKKASAEFLPKPAARWRIGGKQPEAYPDSKKLGQADLSLSNTCGNWRKKTMVGKKKWCSWRKINKFYLRKRTAGRERVKNVALHWKRRAKTRCRRGRRWKIFWRKMHWTWIQDDDDGHLQTDVKAQQVKCEELMEKQQRLGRKIRQTNDTNSSRAKKVDKLERKVKQLEETYFCHNFQKWIKKELKERTKQPKRTAGSSTPIKLFISANWRGERNVLKGR